MSRHSTVTRSRQWRYVAGLAVAVSCGVPARSRGQRLTRLQAGVASRERGTVGGVLDDSSCHAKALQGLARIKTRNAHTRDGALSGEIPMSSNASMIRDKSGWVRCYSPKSGTRARQVWQSC